MVNRENLIGGGKDMANQTSPRLQVDKLGFHRFFVKTIFVHLVLLTKKLFNDKVYL